ncbi:MAG TPA: hypothetical protein VL172_21130 [Kofleriaceae bacterium]|jgi:hypothetical protein|nr:hypothetical protein [Kofleriaceae bacterium]
MGRIRYLAVIGIALLGCCKGSKSPPPPGPAPDPSPPAAGPPPTEFAVHPDLHEVCSQNMVSPPGSDIAEIHWTLYETRTATADVVAWYQQRLGALLVKEDAGWIARLPGADKPDKVLDIDPAGTPGPTCDQAPAADSVTLVRISNAIRR